VPRPPRPPRWGGAIAGWELTRLARRGSPTVARLLVALLLFAALLVTYLAAFPQDLDLLRSGDIQARLSRFGQQFSLALLLVQAAVVFVLTPLFVAGSIVEETERRTLEFLLATDLRPREIILGKLWPRLLLVFGVVLVGWPVLAVTQVWGGVDVVFVGLASLVVLGELWVVAGISAACAVGATSLRRAMVRAYLWSAMALTLPVCTCPLGVIVALSDADAAYAEITASSKSSRFGRPPPAPSPTPVLVGTAVSLGVHLLVQFGIGAWGLHRATFKLRHARYFYVRMPWQQRPRKPQKWEQHPPVPQGSPLLWKEIHLSGQTSRFVRSLSLVPSVVWLCIASVFTLVGWALIIGQSEDVLRSMNQLIRWGGGLLVGLMAVMVGLHAAGSVARERQQETLTDLLTIPRPRREILAAKWVGSLGKARGVAIGTAAVPLVGVIAEGLSYWAVVPLVLAAFAFLACAASFGLWLSVRAPTVQRASGLWLLAVGLWVGGTFLAAEAAYMDQPSAGRYPPVEPPLVWDRAVNPALAWSQLTFRYREDAGPRYRQGSWDGEVESVVDVWPSFLGIVIYALLAWALYAAAARRFEREGQG
jgi:ABC-type transport system involved in multi-copper enzyme maturation permease subunit